jgi:hypothetical protein
MGPAHTYSKLNYITSSLQLSYSNSKSKRYLCWQRHRLPQRM